MKSNPLLKLSHAIGFSGRYCPDVKWSKSDNKPTELLYASGSNIICSET